MVFKSIEQLEKHLLNKIEDAVYVAGEMVYDRADEKLANFYAEYTPDDYNRTYQLRDNSLSFSEIRKTSTGAEVKIGYTDENINYANGNTDLSVYNSMMGEYPHGGFEQAGGRAVFVELLNDLYEYGYADYALETGMMSAGIL